MAKVTKKVLKEIVKQCLVEILVEGLNSEEEEDTLFESIVPKKTVPRKPVAKSVRTISERSQAKNNEQSPVSEAAIKNVAGNDNVMAEIFADTAATTLTQQGLSNESKRGAYVPADGAAKLVQDSNLEDLFDGANNWATLAFSAGKPGD
ncbi:MAG: hypothetical protein CBC29_05630 [Methylococcaceae bacterium TMED69]|nr:MAG: hypothetical protein CBC29_05630 [Methylococcaceae bacterium TMED69]|tara:strand:+ start:406 stop:852 length:447 start_codon:yes stop_codon:yes gene_type:complete